MMWWARAHQATLSFVLPIFRANPGRFSVKIVDSAQNTRAKPRILLPNL
jgi:hypothetical protein